MARDSRQKKAEASAKQSVLLELFDDLYQNRLRVYRFNFVRGLVFGAGSAIGGTVVLALIVWMLALFVDLPVIGNLFNNTLDSIQNNRGAESNSSN